MAVAGLNVNLKSFGELPCIHAGVLLYYDTYIYFGIAFPRVLNREVEKMWGDVGLERLNLGSGKEAIGIATRTELSECASSGSLLEERRSICALSWPSLRS